MLWTILDRAVNLAFLVLAITIITVLTKTGNQDYDNNTLHLNLQASEKRIQKVIDNNLRYVEGRVNGNAQTQDEYQVSTSRRLDLVERKLKALESEKRGLKSQSKNVNSILIQNSGNNVVSN